MVTGRLTQPAVEPFLALRMRGDLRPDARKIWAVGADRLGKVGMLVAGQTSAHLHHLFATLDIGNGSDIAVGLNVFKGPTRVE